MTRKREEGHRVSWLPFGNQSGLSVVDYIPRRLIASTSGRLMTDRSSHHELLELIHWGVHDRCFPTTSNEASPATKVKQASKQNKKIGEINIVADS